jgi:hypothetical protein
LQKCLQEKSSVSNDLKSDIFSGNNIPINLNSSKRRRVSKLIPRSHREINVILIARRTSIFDANSHNIASTTHAIVTSNVGNLYQSTAEGSWGFVIHPEVAEGTDDGGVGVGLSAGASSSFLEEDGAFTDVAGGVLV